MTHAAEYDLLVEKLDRRGVDVAAVKARLARQEIASASWALGNSGTRYAVYPWPGAARTIHEKIEDAAYLNQLSGLSPSIALILPWDEPKDWAALRQYSAERGIRIAALSPTYFQAPEYKLGSLANPDAGIRQKALDHLLEVIAAIPPSGAEMVALWFHDGTNYPGQDSMPRRKRAMEEGLAAAYAALPTDARMLIEYKFYEPGFYHTDFADWGTSYATCLKLGERAQVLVDTGHHPLATNVAHIVSFLLDEGRLGGFHLNSRRYGDDDSLIGSGNAQELFEIYIELAANETQARDVAYMFDQSHNIEPKLAAHLLSAMNAQTAYARALIVNRAALGDLQAAGDVLGAHHLLTTAFNTDVEPLLRQVRIEKNLPPDPLAAHASDGYAARIAEVRGTTAVGGSSMGDSGRRT